MIDHGYLLTSTTAADGRWTSRPISRLEGNAIAIAPPFLPVDLGADLCACFRKLERHNPPRFPFFADFL
jgi:hypothetical protein